MGHARHFHWPLLRAAAIRRSTGGRDMRHAGIEFSDREYRFGLALGRGNSVARPAGGSMAALKPPARPGALRGCAPPEARRTNEFVPCANTETDDARHILAHHGDLPELLCDAPSARRAGREE